MSSHAQQLAASVDGEQLRGRGNLAFRKGFAARTKSLFESFGAPLAGMSDYSFTEVLTALSAFPDYSLSNQILVALQAPHSSSLCSPERWTVLGRRLVRNARPVHIWAPADTRTSEERSASGFVRPTLERAEDIACSLGLRATPSGDFLFDAESISRNPLWGSLQTWKAVRAVRITDGGDHIAIRLILPGSRVLDQRVRTMVGLVKSIMQAGNTPNDETITEYLDRGTVSNGQDGSRPGRSFIHKFRLVPVYDVAETDGPALPEVPSIDFAQALQDLARHLNTQNIEVIIGSARGTYVTGENEAIHIDQKLDPSERFSALLQASADLLIGRHAQSHNRTLLTAERDAIKFVLSMHFGHPCSCPELGRGLAPDVEPHASAEVVKARLIGIHDVAKHIILGARPGYENALVKALADSQQRANDIPKKAAPSTETDAVTVQPSVSGAQQLVAPKSKSPRTKRENTLAAKPAQITPEQPSIAAARVAIAQAVDNFDPFAADLPAVSDEADFNPFA
jgi:hypothetical protein